MITQKEVKELFNYKDGKIYWKKNKSSVKVGTRAGCPHKGSHSRIVRIDKIPYLEHRIIFLYHKGYFPEETIHKNGINDDNHIENIIEATRSQICHRRNIYIGDKSSIYNGICWVVRDKRWRARITKNNKSIYLGQYVDERDAALAYNKAAIELFGEYANLNVIEE